MILNPKDGVQTGTGMRRFARYNDKTTATPAVLQLSNNI